jgi:hypothetical protein
MSDIRQQLLAAKKDIEAKSGQSFSHESLALADLISAFVAIKVADQLQNLKPVTNEKPLTQSVGKPSDDFLYGSG